MNKKICFFCVGTGGHVLPVRNLIRELKALGTKNEDIFVICDNRGKQYLDNLLKTKSIPPIESNYQIIKDLLKNKISVSNQSFQYSKLLKK